jgi:tetratricopeptide (TPR) repeat protein
MTTATGRLVMLGFGVVIFSLATLLQPRAAQWGGRAQSDNLLKVFLGEGRRLFANHFFTQADIVMHSGYYPSIFDQARRNLKTSAMSGGGAARPAPSETPDAGHVHNENCRHEEAPATADHVHDEHCQHGPESEHEREMAFLREPLDWIERFGRRFLITEHTHLTADKELEILPWLRISAELDPQRIETYTVTAYWLKRRGKIAEAEQFLREGLRHNPRSYEILFELGRLYADQRRDLNRARNLLQLARSNWVEQESKKAEPDVVLFEQILVNLGVVEGETGHPREAIALFEQAKQYSPHPQDLERLIEEQRQKLNAPPAPR